MLLHVIDHASNAAIRAISKPFSLSFSLSHLQATAYIFTDMQTTDRHHHAFECYNVTAKRCGALLQWINQV